MAIVLHTIDIIVADMDTSLTFYRDLGFPVDAAMFGGSHAQIDTPGGMTIGLLTEAMMMEAQPDWITPVGQRVTFACHCDAADEVDAVYGRMIAAGHAGRKAPWDSDWGQRYAFLSDPDGNRVDLFAD